MVDRPKKPTALSTKTVSSPAKVTTSYSNSRVSATLPTGESIEILLYGATIISWKDNAGKDLLWLSKAAKLDGSKPVRGGIPLVFPVFGTDKSHTATSKLPSHGFGRLSNWEFLGKSTTESDDECSVKLDFGLHPNNLSEESKELWPYSFGLIYSVTLAQKELITSLMIRNEGQIPWEFQALMHTYFRVQDISAVRITGLESSSFIDKLINPTTTNISPNKPIEIISKIDQVFTTATNLDDPVSIEEQGEKKFSIVRDNMNEVVIWNPWSDGAANIADFAPVEGYKEMICVEAGAVKDWIELGPGETWEGSQIISIL